MQTRKKNAENGTTNQQKAKDLTTAIEQMKAQLETFTRDFLVQEYKTLAKTSLIADDSEAYVKSLSMESLIELVARMQIVEHDEREMSLNECIEDLKLFALQLEHDTLCKKYVEMEDKLQRFLDHKKLREEFAKVA